MRQKDKKLKDLIMQVEDERKQGEQYKDQVRSLNAPMLKHRCAFSCVHRQERNISSICSPGGQVKHPHEAAEAAAGGVGGGVSARYSRPQEAAAGAG